MPYTQTNVPDVPAELVEPRSGIIIERPTGEKQWEFWQHQITDHLDWLCGEGEHKNPNGHRTWKHNIKLARGQHWSEQVQSSDEVGRPADLIEDHVTVSHISLHIENLVSFLTQTDPYFKGRGRRPGDEDSAKAQEAVLNYYWRELDFITELKKCVRDYCTIGHMIARTDWHSRQEIEFQRPDKSKDPAATTNYNPYIRPEAPGFRRVNPFTFLIDRSTPTYDLKGARWCGEIIAKPLQDIISDKRYDSAVRKQIKSGQEHVTTLEQHLANYSSADGFFYGGMDQDESHDQIGLLIEVWDKRFRMRYVFAMGVTKPLIEEAWPYDHLDDFPYEFANFIPVPNEIYGLSHPHIAGQAQLLLDRLLTKMALHARKHNPMYLVPEGTFDDDQKRLFLQNEDGGLVEHKPGKKPEPLELAQLPYDLQTFVQVIKGEMNELMNTDALHRGGALPSRTSAQEIEARQQLHGMKLADHAATIDHFVRNIARQILQHIKANLQQDMFVSIAGREGTLYRKLSLEDIKAEVDIDLESSSREIITPAVEREQRMTLLQTLSALAQSGVPIQIDWNELLKQVLSTFDGVEADRIFPPMAAAPAPINPEFVQGGGEGGGAPNAPAPQPPPTEVNLAQSARQQFAPGGA